MDFTQTFETTTKCNKINHVWSHFYKILVVFEIYEGFVRGFYRSEGFKSLILKAGKLAELQLMSEPWSCQIRHLFWFLCKHFGVSAVEAKSNPIFEYNSKYMCFYISVGPCGTYWCTTGCFERHFSLSKMDGNHYVQWHIWVSKNDKLKPWIFSSITH